MGMMVGTLLLVPVGCGEEAPPAATSEAPPAASAPAADVDTEANEAAAPAADATPAAE